MIGRMSQGEDIEFYGDRYEERQEVLRELHEDTDNPKESFPEEDARESRKTVAQQSTIY